MKLNSWFICLLCSRASKGTEFQKNYHALFFLLNQLWEISQKNCRKEVPICFKSFWATRLYKLFGGSLKWQITFYKFVSLALNFSQGRLTLSLNCGSLSWQVLDRHISHKSWWVQPALLWILEKNLELSVCYSHPSSSIVLSVP